LAICHEVTIDKDTGEYSSSSPDEIAFVEFTEKMGMKFDGKPVDEDKDMIVLHDSVSEPG
jgi:magnesium-transporting ATPase (P-type)